MTTDYHGEPLAEGMHVTAGRDGIPYTGQVSLIQPQERGSGYRRITIIRDDDQTQMETFSDAVVVTDSGEPPLTGNESPVAEF
jgi:hypothetical protein